MVIKTVSYEGLFPTGSFLNGRIGLTADIGAREDAELAVLELVEKCNEIHRKAFPNMYESEPVVSSSTPVAQTVISPVVLPEQQIEKPNIEEIVKRMNEWPSHEGYEKEFRFIKNISSETKESYDRNISRLAELITSTK